MVKVDKPRSPVAGSRVVYPWGELNDRYALGRHTGDDWAAAPGTRVLATHRGTVVARHWGAAYGLHVVLRSRTRVEVGYCHLSRASVHIGQVVDVGELVGLSGATGHVTGPHLHYEERHRPFGFGDDRRPRYTAA